MEGIPSFGGPPLFILSSGMMCFRPLVSIMVGVDCRDSELTSGNSDTNAACGVEEPGSIARAATAIIPKTTKGARIFKFNLT